MNFYISLTPTKKNKAVPVKAKTLASAKRSASRMFPMSNVAVGNYVKGASLVNLLAVKTAGGWINF